MKNMRNNSNRSNYHVKNQNLLQAMIYRGYVLWSNHIAANANVKGKSRIRQSQNILLVIKSLIIQLFYLLKRTKLKTVTQTLVVSLMFLGFVYGYQVNKTVATTADYSDIEAKLGLANDKLSKASTRLALTESLINKNLAAHSAEYVQVEPAGFVSRQTSQGLTANTVTGI